VIEEKVTVGEVLIAEQVTDAEKMQTEESLMAVETSTPLRKQQNVPLLPRKRPSRHQSRL
jgi:hypothetical protein